MPAARSAAARCRGRSAADEPEASGGTRCRRTGQGLLSRQISRVAGGADIPVCPETRADRNVCPTSQTWGLIVKEILDLSACTEFRQTLQARPPRIVHGTVLLLTSLLASAVAWAALTKADLVVRASG